MTAILYFCLIPLLIIILLAQLVYLPISLSALWSGALFWQIWRYYRGKIAPISKWILLGFVMLCLLFIYLQYQSFWGVEAGVALLSSCLFAKCLESKSVRDLLIVFNFGLFVCASLFLHSQSFWMTCLVLIGLVFCFIGLYRIQTYNFEHVQTKKISIKNDAQHVLKFIAFALPFFIILFIFFPRLPPLWRVPIASHQGVTGMSDRMSPGDIAELSQSSALAFRIIGHLKQLPPVQKMYWRAMVLDHYDGAVWTSQPFNQLPLPVHEPVDTDKTVKYQYLAAEPQPWVMSLEQSFPVDSFYQTHMDGSVKPRRLIQQNKPIQLRWKADQNRIYPSDQQQIKAAQQTDFTLQPKTQALARQLWAQSQFNPERYVHKVLDWYRQQGFVYTLSPGHLTANRTDQFLFETQKGFCEHYASSFVILMRYAGIPARVVVGYQGGQLAPDAQSWEVRQLDAHAWAEVYINGQWQRVDPTSAIAPTRLDMGMQQYLQQDQRVWGEQSGLIWKHQFNLLKQTRVWSDYLAYQWQSKVVGYDVDRQQSFLSRLGLHSLYSSVVVMLVAIAILILFYYLKWRMDRRRELSVLEHEIYSFEKKLSVEMKKRYAETFKQWMQRLAEHVAYKQVFFEVIHLQEKIRYVEQYHDQDIVKFRRLLKDCSSEIKRAEKNLSSS
ncbi:transglutaminaseTgpA domain-containing protein [Acinetobacter ihumii]|uniref:transglutaminase family protein n=1 Tax=Acinetobacter ihumii TaxID=2483802 RepID=UPI00103153D5|nr:DUF3488 and transglutaminase-like domain-containing protein [Acinetobacter ihumii]